MLQNSQENNCAKVSFSIELQALAWGISCRFFPVNFVNIFKNIFCIHERDKKYICFSLDDYERSLNKVLRLMINFYLIFWHIIVELIFSRAFQKNVNIFWYIYSKASMIIYIILPLAYITTINKKIETSFEGNFRSINVLSVISSISDQCTKQLVLYIFQSFNVFLGMHILLSNFHLTWMNNIL